MVCLQFIGSAIIPRQLTQIALWEGWSRSGDDCGVGSATLETMCILFTRVDIDRDNAVEETNFPRGNDDKGGIK